MDYTVTGLINAVKLKLYTPLNQNTVTAENIVSIASDEMIYKVIPFIMTAREEYFVVQEDIPMVPNQAVYEIPSKALGTKLRDLQIVDSNGYIRSLPRLEPEFESTYNYNSSSADAICFVMEKNHIRILPIPTSSQYSLRFKYFQTPNALVQNSFCARINTIDTINNILTVDSLPSTIITGSSVDIVRPTPHFDLLLDNKVIQDATGLNITMAQAIPSTLAVGDYLSLTGETCIPMIPKESHNLLVQCVVSEILESMGDIEKLKKSQEKEKEIMESLKVLLCDRVEGENRKIINYSSPLRSRRSRLF